MPSKTITNSTTDAYAIYMAIVETEKVNKSLPYKLAWMLDDIKAVYKIHATRYEKERKEIFDKFGKLDAETNNYNFEAAVIPDVNKAVKELGEIEVETTFISIPSTMLDPVKDLQFAAGAFEILRKDVIEFPKKTEEKDANKKEEKKPEEVTDNE